MTRTAPVARITKSVRTAVTAIAGARFTSNREVLVHVTDGDGDTDHEATERAKDQVVAVLGWGGYLTGFGGWNLQRDHVARPERSVWVD